MKRDNVIYWIATGLVSLILGFSGTMYFINPDMKQAFVHLGFPDYFRVELGIAKLLAVPTLLLPAVSSQIKEWAYAGVAIDFISASIAHTSSGDPAGAVVFPLILLVIMAISYVYYHKLKALQIRFV